MVSLLPPVAFDDPEVPTEPFPGELPLVCDHPACNEKARVLERAIAVIVAPLIFIQFLLSVKGTRSSALHSTTATGATLVPRDHRQKALAVFGLVGTCSSDF